MPPGAALPASTPPGAALPPAVPQRAVPQRGVPNRAAPPGAAQPWNAPQARIPAAEARRTDPVPVAAEPAFDGPFCQACGVRNPQGRRFCRSCGTMLQLPALPPEPRRGWWRRLVERVGGRGRRYSAGERPHGFRDHQNTSATAAKKRGLRLPRHIKLGRLAPLLIIAGLAGVGLGPARTWVTDEVNALLGKAKARVNQHYASVTPVGAAAVSEPGHPAASAIDGLNNTFWASSQHADGVGEVLTIRFASPVDIDQIGILSGADAQHYRGYARPRDLVVTAAGTAPVTLAFDDSADFQSRAAGLRHVSTVTITVKDAYPGQQQHDLAIRDLEFFVKSG
jgi:ribosomal protein L40E